MKFICQLDYPDWLFVTRTGHEGEEFEKGKTTTVATSGCGMCSAVMLADQLIPNCDFDLSAAIVPVCWKSAIESIESVTTGSSR